MNQSHREIPLTTFILNRETQACETWAHTVGTRIPAIDYPNCRNESRTEPGLLEEATFPPPSDRLRDVPSRHGGASLQWDRCCPVRLEIPRSVKGNNHTGGAGFRFFRTNLTPGCRAVTANDPLLPLRSIERGPQLCSCWRTSQSGVG